jgi:hypothetical protein
MHDVQETKPATTLLELLVGNKLNKLGNFTYTFYIYTVN